MRIQITGIDHQLRGVGRLPEGKAAFVPFALPGEEIEATIIEEKERYCIARADEVFGEAEARLHAQEAVMVTLMGNQEA